MELDEMKAAWQELNARVERNHAFDLGTRRELKQDKARAALRRWLWLPAIELGFGVATAVIAGRFLATNIAAVTAGPAGAIPALILLVLGVATMTASIRQFALVGGMDDAAPVLAQQQRLLAAKTLRIRMTQWDFLFGLPLWPVFVAFALQCLGGYASYRALDSIWFLAANFAFGLLVAAALVWLARRCADRLERSPVMRKLADEIAGRELVIAIGHLDELARFERE